MFLAIYEKARTREDSMQLFLFARHDDKSADRLEAAVRDMVPEGAIELFTELSALQKRLRIPVEPDSIAVLSAADRDELRAMEGLRHLLPEIRVILVLPDLKKHTIRLAHLLLPRFISVADDDFSDLKKVLHKMIRTARDSQDGDLQKAAAAKALAPK
jgi:hypothetical protein